MRYKMIKKKFDDKSGYDVENFLKRAKDYRTNHAQLLEHVVWLTEELIKLKTNK